MNPAPYQPQPFYNQPQPFYNQPQQKSKLPLIIGIVIVLVIIFIAVLFMVSASQQNKKDKTDKLNKIAKEKRDSTNSSNSGFSQENNKKETNANTFEENQQEKIRPESEPSDKKLSKDPEPKPEPEINKPAIDPAPGLYKIQHVINNRYLDAYERAGGDAVTRKNQNDDTQTWFLREVKPKHYKIQQLESGLYLTQDKLPEYYMPIKSALDNVLVLEEIDGANQTWKIERVSKNTYRISIDSKYLDGHTGGTQDYGIVLRDHQDNNSQHWFFTKV